MLMGDVSCLEYVMAYHCFWGYAVKSRKNDEEAIQKERKPNDDHDNFNNNLVRDNVPYHASEDEEQYKEERCELLGNPRQEPPV
uniref:Uncharacterized protein n=1 Tax=Tanacetum cinerariifolium TaxID=118510 RepID=A0A699HDA7_TANCI|nr:hypothetical protein [Tanacetum cinerariifolium]